MDKTIAIIRKKGSEYCVFSQDGKNLGCSKTLDGAKKRLKQVEFFKRSKSDGKTATRKKKRGKRPSTYSEIIMVDGVKNPTDSHINSAEHVKSVNENRKVPDVKLPSLDNTGKIVAQFNAATPEEKRALAEDVSERLNKRIKTLQEAKKLADRFLKSGITGDEFSKLVSYLQEEIVSDLSIQGVKASSEYRSKVLIEAAIQRRGK